MYQLQATNVFYKGTGLSEWFQSETGIIKLRHRTVRHRANLHGPVKHCLIVLHVKWHFIEGASLKYNEQLELYSFHNCNIWKLQIDETSHWMYKCLVSSMPKQNTNKFLIRLLTLSVMFSTCISVVSI